MSEPLPDAAITAFREALSAIILDRGLTFVSMYPKTVAQTVLHAVAPALRAQGAATEREACARLADEVGARYTTHELPDYTTTGRVPMHHRFADLIRARNTPPPQEGTTP